MRAIRKITFLALLFSIAIFSCQKKNAQDDIKLEKETTELWTEFFTSEGNRDTLFAQNQELRRKNPILSIRAAFNYYSLSSSYYWKVKSDYQKALVYIDSAIAVLGLDPEYNMDIAEALFTKADILVELGSYDGAFNTYFTSKKYVDKINDACMSNKYSYRIAMVLYKQRKFQDAGYFFKKGLKEIEACTDIDVTAVTRVQEYQNNIALCYSKNGQLDSAVFWYKKALRFIEHDPRMGNHNSRPFLIAKGVLLGNLGGVLIQKGDYLEGEKLLKESISINDRDKFERRDALTAKLKLIDYFLFRNNFPAAKQLINEVDTSSYLGQIELKQIFLKLKSSYHEKTGNSDLALVALKEANEISDSIQKELDGIKSINLSERFDFLDVEQKVGALVQERDSQKRLLAVVLTFIAVAIVLLIMIYIYWSRSRNSLKELELLNVKVVDQNVQLAQTLIDLELSDREKDGILRTVAHDLRNPLAGIVTVIGLMLEEDRTEEDQYKLDLLKDASGGALALINDLMEATENKNITEEVDKTEEELVSLIKKNVEFSNFKAQEKDQTISFVSDIKAIAIKINKDKINRVIANLIANAIKFSPNHTEITVKLGADQRGAYIQVIDQGIGISEEMKKEVFMIFTRAKRFGTNGEKSHGLGLSICQQIIESHKGNIWIEDNPGGGSIFHIYLPLA